MCSPLMLYLEQLLLKNNIIDDKCMQIDRVSGKNQPLAFNFHFLSKSHTLGILSFLRDTVMCKVLASKQLISHDNHSNIFVFNHTLTIDIVPICPFDLCLLPKQIMKDGGGIGPLVLVYKISKYIHVLDAFSSQKTIRTYEINEH